ncbi:MAG: FAD-binding oxidoreductase [Pseudonocardiaceae bacterium]
MSERNIHIRAVGNADSDAPAATRRRPSRSRKRTNSHETFVHDSIDSLGYDWARIAEPHITPKFPLKVYLPRTTDDVIEVVKEVKSLGHRLGIRSKGHSSNDLVLMDGGSILLTEKLNAILEIDEQEMTATVQAGAVSAEVDDVLATRGSGLPVIGDHGDLTMGGFSSVGGISASSFRYGLFADTVQRLEYVTWDGELISCSRSERPDHFYNVLLGLGRHGVIVTLTVRIVRIDKYSTIWRNEQSHERSFERFLERTQPYLAEPPADARFIRGMWVDFNRRFGLGQFSVYQDTAQTPNARVRSNLAYGFLHRVGYVAGRLPSALDKALKYVGQAGILFSPRYASVKDAESFADRIVDATVGEPTRSLVVIARVGHYEALCRRLLDLMRDYRDRHQCFTVITLYVKGIRSEYLSGGNPDDAGWLELLFYLGINPDRMSEQVLDQLVNELDDICIETGSFRYMHSRTTKDPERRALVDPNTVSANRVGSVRPAAEEAPHFP